MSNFQIETITSSKGEVQLYEFHFNGTKYAHAFPMEGGLTLQILSENSAHFQSGLLPDVSHCLTFLEGYQSGRMMMMLAG